MEKCKIIVWDYRNNMHGWPVSLPPPENFEPVEYEVEAWCVGGSEGIKAFFFIDNMICMADGDDGHWWLVDRFHMHWIHEIEEAVHAAAEEEKKLAKTKRIKRIERKHRRRT